MGLNQKLSSQEITSSSVSGGAQDKNNLGKSNPGKSDSGKNNTGKYNKLIDKVFTCVNEHLLILMNQMLHTADGKLFDLSEKAESNEEQIKYMDCTRIFRTEKTDISRHFFINLNNSLTIAQAKNGSNGFDETSSGELSLVGQDEMDEMVAITTMHAKAMSLFGEEVNHLEARLEYLEIFSENAFEKEALDPRHICQVFQKTIENIELAIEVKLVFYRIFDQEVCSKLGVMYKAINQLFIDNDVMPEIILKTAKQEEVDHEEEEVSSRVATYYDPNENVSTDFIPRTKKEISRVVNEFMSGEMTITGDEIELPESFMRAPTQKDLDGKSCYEKKEVVKALSKLQHKLALMHDKDKAEMLTADEIKQELLSNISSENGGVLDKQVSLLDERSIDFVGMMFGAIADDNTVSELMTNLIYQLQVPVIKVAMSDITLFEEEDHPARSTVDLMTSAGKGINSEKDHLYDELKVIVDDILDDFELDIATFIKAVDTLESIIQKEDLLASETERQQQKEVLQEHARNIVVHQLKMISCDKTIPNKIRPLVLKHWSTLMLNRYIRHGRNSEQWVQSVLLLKLLLKCMQPIQFQSQYKLIKSNQDALIEAVNDELYETQQSKDEIATQVAELKQHLIQLVDEYNLKIVDEDDNEITEEELMESSTDDDTEEELQKIQQATEVAKQKIAQLASSTKPGVWYEIFNGEDKPIRRLKLSVILTDAAQLIFVNRKGIKVIEKDAEEFARELEEDRSRILADHSTFDYALGQVITALAA